MSTIAIQERCVFVTGAWSSPSLIRDVLWAYTDALQEQAPPHTEIRWTLVHGAARGADSMADEAARRLGWKRIACPVTREDWNRLGKRAGILRNDEMIHKHRPHYAFAFLEGKSRGTRDAIQRLGTYADQIDSRLLHPLWIIERK